MPPGPRTSHRRDHLTRSAIFSLTALGWVAVILAGTTLASALVPATPNVAVIVAQGMFALWLCLAALVALVAALTQRPHLCRVAACIAALWAAWALTTALTAMPLRTSQPALSVAAANVYAPNTASAVEIADALVSLDADVITASETNPTTAAEITLALGDDYHLVGLEKSAMGDYVALWSRLPIVATAPVHIGAATFPSATVKTSAGPVIVTGVHITAPIFGGRLPQPPLAEWFAELGALALYVRSSPLPVVLAGDFNATITHAPLSELLTVSTDAASTVGHIYSPTWPTGPGRLPLLGIDHVIQRGLGIADYDTFSIPGSDHAGVRATLGPIS